MLRDTQSDLPEILVETVKGLLIFFYSIFQFAQSLKLYFFSNLTAGGPVKEEESPEPEPPEAFEWKDE
jgi:hypothetical protein